MIVSVTSYHARCSRCGAISVGHDSPEEVILDVAQRSRPWVVSADRGPSTRRDDDLCYQCSQVSGTWKTRTARALRALALREQGLSYREIGAAIGTWKDPSKPLGPQGARLLEINGLRIRRRELARTNESKVE